MLQQAYTRHLLATAHSRARAAAYDAGFRPAPSLRDVQRAASVTRSRMPGPNKHWHVHIRPAVLAHDSLTLPAALDDFHHDCRAYDAYEARAKAWQAWSDRFDWRASMRARGAS